MKTFFLDSAPKLNLPDIKTIWFWPFGCRRPKVMTGYKCSIFWSRLRRLYTLSQRNLRDLASPLLSYMILSYIGWNLFLQAKQCGDSGPWNIVENYLEFTVMFSTAMTRCAKYIAVKGRIVFYYIVKMNACTFSQINPPYFGGL